ncbi:spore coat protein, partial [bacterium]|nr:spore coat protein [bacterium]
MKIAILQARVSSSRLPRKVLKILKGKPMLLHQIERVAQSKRIDQLYVATSNLAEDDEIEDLCNQNGINCFRGSLSDVLDRYYQLSSILQPSHIVRLTGDCPLIDHKIIDNVID